MTQDLIDQILTNTYTQAEALRRVSILKDIVTARLFNSNKELEKTRLHLNYQQNAWLDSLDPNFYRHFTKENIYKIFEEMATIIKKIQPLVLYFPFEIPENEIVNIGNNLRKNYGKNFLFEIKYDPSLIAGTALVWNGIYKDYSIRQKIANNHEMILEMLKSYIHK